MPSERIQRRIDALLDEADEATSQQRWDRVAGAARAVLAIDEANEDARAFLKMAAANGADGADGVAPVSSLSAHPEAPPSEGEAPVEGRHAKPPEPTSFVGGRYHVRRFLGEGGKKRVFLAHDESLDRDVAFALIKTEGLDATGRQRVVREAQAMGRMGTHPHVVAIFEIGEEDGAPYVVTELLGGGDVEGLLQKSEGVLPLVRALSIAKDVCDGLVFAHAQGIVHRDLKPGNVWLTNDGVAKIGDFGLAVNLGRSRLTQHGLMVGTVAYMPPEQALGGEVTPQSDLYSLGAMLYELVTGKPPFQADDPTAVISQHINTPPVAPSWNSDRCPPDLEDLILHLLAKVPADRPASAREVLTALERVDPEAKSASHSDSSANPLDRLARGVFVGRERELERLRGAFDDAFAGHGSVVMLVGEPGIGKTRTAQELETYARMRGAKVAWGRAHESAGAPPFWPWYQLGLAYSGQLDQDTLRAQLGDDAVELQRLWPQVRTVVPGLAQPVQAEADEASQFRLFAAVTAFFRRATEQAPLLLVLDDLHWADKPSLLLLQHIASELGRARILLLGTFRDTELSRTHPLSETLVSLNRETGFVRIALRGLTADEVAAYIRATAAVDPSADLAHRMFEETEGNPFFLSEVVNLLTEEGAFRPRRAPLADVVLPDGVREALGRRLDRLSEEANELMAVASVVGREFTYDTLTLLGDRADDALLRLIEEGLNARVIEEMESAGRYRFTHALMQETLLAELSTTRRVRLHGRVAEALERRYGTNADARAARLAQHFLESATLNREHAQKAARYSKLAAEQAELVAAWDEAARHYQNCLAQVREADDRFGEDEARLLAALGRCQTLTAEFRLAWRSLLSALDLYRARGDWMSGAQVALAATVVLAPGARLVAVLTAALQAPGDRDRLLELRLLAARARWSGSAPEGDADDRAARALAAELAVQVPDDLSMREATLMEARGQVEEAARAYAELGERLDAQASYGAAAHAFTQASLSARWAGDLDLAAKAGRRALDYARRFHVRRSEADGLRASANLAILKGAFDEARAFPEASTFPGFTEAMTLGDIAEATGDRQLIERAAPSLDTIGAVPWIRLIVHALRARAYFLAGDAQRAREDVSALAEALGEVTEEQQNLVTATFAVPALDAVRDRWLTEQLYEWLEQRRAIRVAAAGSADRLRGDLALLLNRPDDAERHYREGLAWCRRERCPIEEGRCLQGLAEIAERRVLRQAPRLRSGEPQDERGLHALAMEHLDAAGALFSRYGAKRLLDQVLAKKQILKA